MLIQGQGNCSEGVFGDNYGITYCIFIEISGYSLEMPHLSTSNVGTRKCLSEYPHHNICFSEELENIIPELSSRYSSIKSPLQSVYVNTMKGDNFV